MSEMQAFLRVESDLSTYENNSFTANEGISWLLDNLPVKGDPEYGVQEVSVTVIASRDGTLYDILLNGESIGYLGVKTFAKTVEGLKEPELITLAPSDDIATVVRSYSYEVYYLPAMAYVGDIDEA